MNADHNKQLEVQERSSSTPQNVVLRSRICLLTHEGIPHRQIALKLKTSRPTVIHWRKRFIEDGPSGLEHRRARSDSQASTAEQVKLVVDTTLQTTPKDAAGEQHQLCVDSILSSRAELQRREN